MRASSDEQINQLFRIETAVCRIHALSLMDQFTAVTWIVVYKSTLFVVNNPLNSVDQIVINRADYA